MFSDGIRYWGCIAVMFAFAIFLQQRFTVNLEEETVTLTEDLLSDWMEVQGGWEEAASGIGGDSFCLSFIHYLIGTTCLLLLLITVGCISSPVASSSSSLPPPVSSINEDTLHIVIMTLFSIIMTMKLTTLLLVEVVIVSFY